MATTVELGDIGLDANSSNADKFLRAIADNTVTVTLPTVDENSPNMDKLLYHIYTNGVGGGSTSSAIIGRWWNGSLNPPTINQTTLAKEHDFYLNETTKKYYYLENGAWREIGTLQGVDGVYGTKWYNSYNSQMETALGNDGDYFLNNDTGIYHVKESGQWVQKGDLKGEQGVQGLQGSAGPVGARGPAGPQGPRGADGATITIGDTTPETAGVQGELNDIYIDRTTWTVYQFFNTSWVNKGTIKGADGATGPVGERGEAGAQGPMGPAGPAGEKGEAGVAGPAGAIGPQGPQGQRGAKWYNGADLPQVTADILDGDHFINDQGVVYELRNRQWADTNINLKGPTGQAGTGTTVSGTTWKNGNGDPNNGTQGNAGEYYVNDQNGTIYRSNGGTSWTEVGANTRVTYIDGTNQSNNYLTGGWTSQNVGFKNACYYRKNGVIYFDGVITSSGVSTNTHNTPITTALSVRPRHKLVFPVATSNTTTGNTGYTTGYVSIGPDGILRYHGGHTQFLSLSGISFALTSN